MSNTLTVRRGARVLHCYSNGATIGHVEGESFYREGVSWVFRAADGSIGWAAQGGSQLVAVDAGTVLVEDQGNNVGRLCNVRGDAAAGHPNRCWQVVAAVSGQRLAVRHLDYGYTRLVSERFDVTNLY